MNAKKRGETRVLYYVPIVHTATDLGSQAEAFRKRLGVRIGEAGLRRRDAALRRMWAAIRERVLRLKIDWSRARVYQDGIPVCGRELEIVREVAAAGSENHLLVLDLVKRGAAVVGTEDPALLRSELERMAELSALDAQGPVAVEVIARLKAKGDLLLAERDAFIARRVDETLGTEEVGLGFFGLLHRVNERLPADIAVRMLMPDLPLSVA